MYPNIQAYDRGTMFSPDGRLFQVEYAKESVKKGATAVGIVAKDAVVFIAHKNVTEPLAVPESLQKIFRIDSFIGATYSGIASDGLRVINLLRAKTQSHRMVYDETESIETISIEISEEMQMATQYGGIRPYAISLLVGGVDTNPRLFEIDPSGVILGYKADAIGMGKSIAEEILTKEYKDNMEIDDAIKLGVKIITKAWEKKITKDNIEIAVISKKGKYKNYTQDQIEKYI